MSIAEEDPHFRNVAALLARYEAEFAQMMGNPNTPPDQVTELLVAINALRAEKALLSGRG